MLKLGINRNILECKVFSSIENTAISSVLIETYWNVKTGKHRQSLTKGQVLIETYWNVKVLKCAGISVSKDVLIETYWNVKTIFFVLRFCCNSY